MATNELCVELAQYTAHVNQILEDKELQDFDDRLYYLGHLAMCARLFMIIHLGKPADELLEIYKVESNSYGAAGLRCGKRGEDAKQAWLRFAKVLKEYIEFNTPS